MKIKAIPLFLIFYLINGSYGLAEEKNREYFERRGEVVWEVPTDKKVIALTFDDGPDPVHTPQVLDLLRQYHAQGTFFVTGKQVIKHPDIAKREASEGHELANHSFNHPNLRRLTKDGLKKEILKSEEAIHSVTGESPKLFRPPGGYYNEKIVSGAKEQGYLVVMWSWHQDTKDWADPGVEKIVEKVLTNARKGDIVLFHDYGGDRGQTVKALKQILPILAQRGYQFVTVSQLIRLRDSKVNDSSGD